MLSRQHLFDGSECLMDLDQTDMQSVNNNAQSFIVLHSHDAWQLSVTQFKQMTQSSLLSKLSAGILRPIRKFRSVGIGWIPEKTTEIDGRGLISFFINTFIIHSASTAQFNHEISNAPRDAIDMTTRRRLSLHLFAYTVPLWMMSVVNSGSCGNLSPPNGCGVSTFVS